MERTRQEEATASQATAYNEAASKSAAKKFAEAQAQAKKVREQHDAVIEATAREKAQQLARAQAEKVARVQAQKLNDSKHTRIYDDTAALIAKAQTLTLALTLALMNDGTAARTEGEH